MHMVNGKLGSSLQLNDDKKLRNANENLTNKGGLIALMRY